jgi:hypothetical protein
MQHDGIGRGAADPRTMVGRGDNISNQS